MLKDLPADSRTLRQIELDCDLAVVGGGLAGLCCAVTAARAGSRVVLVHDRPVLGGNASSEIRMIILGATSSRANNNRWSREGGLIDEILVENVYRNPLGNPVLLDSLLLEKAVAEDNLKLLLNTPVFEVEKRGNRIVSIGGFCPQNQTRYHVRARLFCDASGDGIAGFLGGAAFRMGAEGPEEFDERFAPKPEFGELLGHTLYFYSKDAGRPAPFVAPAFAMRDVAKITRHLRISPRDYGRQLWWLEYGGRLDTVHDTEEIKWELWRVVYGIWDFIKNSGRFPDVDNLTLEWVGTIPGKRESRRFEGDYILSQRDVVERRMHADTVSYGGWALDLHPADGIYSELPPCVQWHSKGIYPIPYRALYSRNVENLFLAGRIISASHVAFGSTRVMATCAHAAQSVGAAADFCRREGCLPRDVGSGARLAALRLALSREGQYIPGYRRRDPADLAQQAEISASSTRALTEIPADGAPRVLAQPWALLAPLSEGPVPGMTFAVRSNVDTWLDIALRVPAPSEIPCFTPEVTLSERRVAVSSTGNQRLRVDFDVTLERPGYAFICISANPDVELACAANPITGLISVTHLGMACVTEGAVQKPGRDIGVDTFEFWRTLPAPDDRPIAVEFDAPLEPFSPRAVANGVARPTDRPNAWAAALDDPNPALTLRWKTRVRISRVVLVFDTDLDNPLFSVLTEHPERVLPCCIREYTIKDGTGRVLHHETSNHQTRGVARFTAPVETDCLHIEFISPQPGIPAAVFEVQCYE